MTFVENLRLRGLFMEREEMKRYKRSNKEGGGGGKSGAFQREKDEI
jgi:hypothetical protein